MVFDDKKYELKQMVDSLKKFHGSGTELISVYIAQGANIYDMSNKLKNEYGQAGNIKSKSTRKNVQEALEKIIHHMKIYRETPKNGLAIFCGNISNDESKTDIRLFTVEPYLPIKITTYRCDSSFFLEPLEEMLEEKDAYGVIAMDGKEATIAKVIGTDIRILKRLNSTAHSKIRKGGQSANRYARLIEESIEKYYQRIGEAMDELLLGKGIKGILVGGPGPAKEDFLKMKPFNYQHKIIGVVDTGYTDEQGVKEILEKSEQFIENLELNEQRKYYDRFIKEIVKDGLATYGYKQVIDAINSRNVEVVLLSEDLDYYIKICRCSNCNNAEQVLLKKDEFMSKFSDQTDVVSFSSYSENLVCSKCNKQSYFCEYYFLPKYIVSIARDNNLDVKFISSNFNEGQQFLQAFRGIGAILRYKTMA
ncbi:MAG: peptide chain release factor aRF-1 [Candidatus Micrarchaeota archaeon]|nr:peptide chain release factor aRF-1 [Candidatus Micrarchaeota archaeon]